MKRYFIFLLLPVMIQFSCAATKHLPSPKEFKDHVYGLQIEATIVDQSAIKKTAEKFVGEIIAVEEDAIFIRLNTNEVIRHEKGNLVHGKIKVAKTSNKPEAIALWAVFLNLVPASHGIYAILSFPPTLAITTSIAVDANKSAYTMEYPDEVYWEELKKFARFPQGLPPGFLD